MSFLQKGKLNTIDNVYEKHILTCSTRALKTSFLWEIDLVEFEITGLANLTVQHVYFILKCFLFLFYHISTDQWIFNNFLLPPLYVSQVFAWKKQNYLQVMWFEIKNWIKIWKSEKQKLPQENFLIDYKFNLLLKGEVTS